MWNRTTQHLSIHELYITDYSVVWNSFLDYFNSKYQVSQWDMEYFDVVDADHRIVIHVAKTTPEDAWEDRAAILDILENSGAWYSYMAHHRDKQTNRIGVVTSKEYVNG